MKTRITDDSFGDRTVTWEDVRELLAHLKQTARELLRHEANAGTVHTTQLLNDALVKMNPQSRDWQKVSWRDRDAFFKDAFHMMRRVLIEYARKRHRKKRRVIKVGGFQSDLVNPLIEAGELNLDHLVDHAGSRAELAEAIDHALTSIEHDHPGERLGELVEYRAFAGLNQADTAAMIGISVKTVWKREKLAYGLLRRALRDFFPRLASHPPRSEAQLKGPIQGDPL